MLEGKHIVIGVTGGIAAYKSVYLLRKLQESRAQVRVVMTESATRFVGIDTFASLTRHEVPIHIFPGNATSIPENWTRHIQWGEWADLIVVAPCTANSLAKMVHGISDSMLTATILAARCPILICPAMDGEMYRAPATRHNLQRAREMGFHLLEPETGYLASGITGTGRLPEPEDIFEKIRLLLTRPSDARQDKNQPSMPTGPLKDRDILVTCGPTREFIDPVRFLSNPSTGKMGMAMAMAAEKYGGRVTLLHARSLDVAGLPASISTQPFVTTDDLFALVKAHLNHQVIIMAAAVSDFKPTRQYSHKVKKDTAEPEIILERTPDILEWLGRHRTKDHVIIGFAMETEKLAVRTREKRIKKKADWMAGNSLSEEGSGFESDTNQILLVGPNQNETLIKGTKQDVADKMLLHIFKMES